MRNSKDGVFNVNTVRHKYIYIYICVVIYSPNDRGDDPLIRTRPSVHCALLSTEREQAIVYWPNFKLSPNCTRTGVMCRPVPYCLQGE